MEIRLEIDQSKLDYDEINKKLLEKIDGLSSEDVLRFAYPKTYMGFYGGCNFPEDESNNLTELITERLISSIMMQEDGNDFKVFDENNGKLTYKGLDMVTREFQNVFRKHINSIMKPIIESEELNKLLVDTFFKNIAGIYVQVLKEYCNESIYSHETHDEHVRQILQGQIDEIKSRFNMY